MDQSIYEDNIANNIINCLARNHRLKDRKEGAMVDSNKRRRMMVSRAFAKTALPMNIFRSSRNRSFLNSVIDYGKIPDYRSLENDMAEIAKNKLESLKLVTHFGIHLHHWTSRRGEKVLVVIVSWIGRSWKSHV